MKIYLSVLFLLLAVIYSCSNNPVTTGSNTVLFTYDSISVKTSDSGNVNLLEGFRYYYNSAFDIHMKLQIEYTGYSNADTVFPGAFMDIEDYHNTPDSVVNILYNKSYYTGNFPGYHIDTFTVSIAHPHSLRVEGTVAIPYSANHNMKYFTMKNIKITQVN